MFDIRIRKKIDPWLDRIALGIVRLGIQANTITWFGFVVGIAGSVCVANGGFTAAFVLILINRICDGLDGCVARYSGPSDLGGFLDIALDMIFYSSIPFGFAVASSINALPAAFLIFSFAGTGCSFLAFAIISAKRGLTADREGKKSFFYSTGLIEGTETVVFLLLVCLVPLHFPLLAWVFGSLCWLTTAIRIAIASQVFRGDL